MARIQMSTPTWWRRTATVVCAVAALLATCSSSSHAQDIAASNKQRPQTTCYALRADPAATTISRSNILSRTTGAACPLAIDIVFAPTSVSVNETLTLTWNVTTANATALAAMTSRSTSATRTSKQPFVVTHAAIHLCSHDQQQQEQQEAACDPFSTAFQTANVSANQPLTLASGFRNADSITFESEGEVAFTAAGAYVIAAYVVVAMDKRQRFDFIVQTTVSVTSSDESNARSESATQRSSLPLDVSTGQFVLICVLLALAVTGVAVAVALVVRRHRQHRPHGAAGDKSCPSGGDAHAKVSHTGALSPRPDDAEHDHHEMMQRRFSDWSEIYATQGALPSSILLDDSNTIAILRASRVSSPMQSTHHHERRVADFTRDVGYWDVRLSASPITPLSSCFFPLSSSSASSMSSTSRMDMGEHDDVDLDGGGSSRLASPTESFVPLETLGRTRPQYVDVLDHRRGFGNGGDVGDEDDEHEVEF